MTSIAITGGIGSGKSYVSVLLQAAGIPVYNTDNEAKRLMLSDEGIRQDLIDLLGEGVYTDGTLNKPMLASYLFAGPENAARINAIVHPSESLIFRTASVLFWLFLWLGLRLKRTAKVLDCHDITPEL